MPGPLLPITIAIGRQIAAYAAKNTAEKTIKKFGKKYGKDKVRQFTNSEAQKRVLGEARVRKIKDQNIKENKAWMSKVTKDWKKAGGDHGKYSKAFQAEKAAKTAARKNPGKVDKEKVSTAFKRMDEKAVKKTAKAPKLSRSFDTFLSNIAKGQGMARGGSVSNNAKKSRGAGAMVRGLTFRGVF